MGASKYVYIDVEEIVYETAAAFLFRVDGKEIWIPKSQMADPDDYSEGDIDVSDVAITEWIAKQKEIESE